MKRGFLLCFHATWCVWSKQFMPTWLELVDLFDQTDNIHAEAIDCNKDYKFADEFKINGYPTIKLVILHESNSGEFHETVHEYDVDPQRTFDSVKNFVMELME
jgi:hypothetical protein